MSDGNKECGGCRRRRKALNDQLANTPPRVVQAPVEENLGTVEPYPLAEFDAFVAMRKQRLFEKMRKEGMPLPHFGFNLQSNKE